jgi:hypothetical protein
MAEAIIGTPSIVGFGSDMRGDGLNLGTMALLIQQSLGRDHAEISRDVQSTSRAVEESVEHNAMAINIAVEKTGAASLLATEKTAAATQLAILGVQLEMAKIAGIAALTAATNTAAIQASIAACCCETKALIIEKAGATDALIRELRMQDQAIQINDLKMQLIAAQAAAAAAP